MTNDSNETVALIKHANRIAQEAFDVLRQLRCLQGQAKEAQAKSSESLNLLYKIQRICRGGTPHRDHTNALLSRATNILRLSFAILFPNKGFGDPNKFDIDEVLGEFCLGAKHAARKPGPK